MHRSVVVMVEVNDPEFQQVLDESFISIQNASHKNRKFTDKEYYDAYSKGWNDTKISKLFNCTVSACRGRRLKLNLHSHCPKYYISEEELKRQRELLRELSRKDRNNWASKNIEKVKQTTKKYRIIHSGEWKPYMKKYNKKRYKKNKEMMLEQSRKHYKKNKKIINKRHNEYYKKNKEMMSEQHKKYYKKNKEEIKRKASECYLKNKEIINKRNREYYKKNKEQINKRKSELHKIKRGVKT